MASRKQPGPFVIVFKAGDIIQAFGPFDTRLDANEYFNRNELWESGGRVVAVFPPQWRERDLRGNRR